MSSYQFDSVERKLKAMEAKLGQTVEIPVMPATMLEFAKQYRYVRKQPFSFDYRDERTGAFIPNARVYLNELYTTDADRIVVVKGRQMEITEYATNYILYHALKHQGVTIIYTSPRQDQVSRFSKRRLRKEGIKDSKALRAMMDEEPNVHEINLGESIVYMYSAWSDADAIRNIPGDIAVLDEYQDIPRDALPVVEEALAHSSLQKMLVIGTPKDAGSSFDELWRLSSQKEWDKALQTWVARQQGDPWEGYHITQTLAPWITQRQLDYKRRTYTAQKYANEVLGEFWKGAGRPLTVDDMIAITDTTQHFYQSVDIEHNYPVYAGVDWGLSKANTVFLAVEVDDKDPREPAKYKIIYVENVSYTTPDLLAQVPHIIHLIELFNVKRLCADIGAGKLQVDELRKTFGDRILACDYKGNVKEPIKQTVTSLGPVVQVDRSLYIDKAIDVIKRKRITLMGADREMKEWFWDNCTSIFLEASESTVGRNFKRWSHDDGKNDDAFQSLVYALIAYEVDNPYVNAPHNVVDFNDPYCIDFSE